MNQGQAGAPWASTTVTGAPPVTVLTASQGERDPCAGSAPAPAAEKTRVPEQSAGKRQKMPPYPAPLRPLTADDDTSRAGTPPAGTITEVGDKLQVPGAGCVKVWAVRRSSARSVPCCDVHRTVPAARLS